VAIRNAAGVWVYLRIRRNPETGIYVIARTSWRSGKIAQNPHVSYHVDGRVHQKTYGELLFAPIKGPPLNAFTGVFRLCGFAIRAVDAQGKLPEPCDAAKFDHVFEVSATRIAPHEHGDITQFEVQLAEPGFCPSPPLELPPGGKPALLTRHTYDDHVPWIVVSLYHYKGL
jgi:hypothetical protein